MTSKKLFEIGSEKSIDKLHLYQSDVYYLEYTNGSIYIVTNDGRVITIKGDFKMCEAKLE